MDSITKFSVAHLRHFQGEIGEGLGSRRTKAKTKASAIKLFINFLEQESIELFESGRNFRNGKSTVPVKDNWYRSPPTIRRIITTIRGVKLDKPHKPIRMEKFDTIHVSLLSAEHRFIVALIASYAADWLRHMMSPQQCPVKEMPECLWELAAEMKAATRKDGVFSFTNDFLSALSCPNSNLLKWVQHYYAGARATMRTKNAPALAMPQL